MSKLATHVIPVHWGQSDDEQLRRLQPKSIKIVDPDPNRVQSFYAMCPYSVFVLRDWALSEQKDDVRRDAAGTGKRHAEEWYAKLKLWNLGIPAEQLYILGINEPPVWEQDGITQAVAYNVALLDRCKELGIRAGALNLSVGWPANTGPDTLPNWTPYEPVRDAIIRGNHALVLHEYWDRRGPAFNWGWWAGRYTKCPWDVPIVMGEAGLDQYVSDPGVGGDVRGWQGQVSRDEYRAQLGDYASRLETDKRVHSAQVFTWDYASQEWRSFDVRPVLPDLPVNDDFTVYIPGVYVPPTWDRLTIIAYIRQQAIAAGLNPDLLVAQASVESAFNPGATGQAGEYGLFQILPSTWAELGVTGDPYGVEPNTAGAVAYLKRLKAYLPGASFPWLLAAYNWGPGNVKTLLDGGGTFWDLPAVVRDNYVREIYFRAGVPFPLEQGDETRQRLERIRDDAIWLLAQMK